MPLYPGKENIGRNIKELTEHGTRPRSHRQIVAIALATARKSGAKIPPPPGSRFNKKNG
jgi:hypothetical protein